MSRLVGTDSSQGPERAGPLPPAGRNPAEQSPDAMTGEPLQRKVILTNPLGLHMRPMSAFVQLAGKYQSKIFVIGRDNNRVDGRSMFGLMSLAAEQGTELILEASGPDAEGALEALANLLANLSDMDAELA
jgi:phosphocarrier protein HPr